MKRLLTALMTVVMLITLPGCGSKPKEEAAGFRPALDTKASAKVLVAGNYSNFEALEAIFDDFNAIYPNVELSYFKPDDYNNMIGTILEGSDAPDIYFTYYWMFGRELYAPCLTHAEDLSDPALGLNIDGIRPNLLSRDENGGLPMIPVFATTHGMLVNNDLFQKEGVSVPKTYPELLAVCSTLKEKGYASPIMGYNGNPSNSLVNSVTYPYFCGTIAGDAEAVEAANSLSPDGGEYMRPALERMMDLLEQGCIDLDECAKIEDNYTALILRFFEGDVPMMICNGDTVSGTKKRESQSEAFTAEPFTYSFVPIPLTEDGTYLLDASSVQFSVNKDSKDLDMVNEFMRFLLSTEELNKMAEIKRLMTPGTDLTYDSIYAALAEVNADRIISPEAAHISDDSAIQMRLAAYQVVNGGLSIDDAVAQYGTFVQN